MFTFDLYLLTGISVANQEKNEDDQPLWKIVIGKDVTLEMVNQAIDKHKNDLLDYVNREIMPADLKKDDKCFPTCTGTTALMMLAHLGNKELMEKLLNSGADINKKNEKGMTALSYAIISSKNKDIIKMLLDRGADMYVENNSCRFEENCIKRKKSSIIEMAFLEGNIQIIELLLQKRADINKKNSDGLTVLMSVVTEEMRSYDCYERKKEIIKLLLHYGADVNVKNNQGKTVLDLFDELTKKELKEIRDEIEGTRRIYKRITKMLNVMKK